MTHLPRGLWVLLAANVVIALGFGLIAPALPIFADTFGVTELAVSAVISAFALMRLLFAPTTGRLVTRLGERRIYLTGLVIVAVSTLACGFAASYWQLLLFRAAGGIGSTMFSLSAMALLIRLAPPQLRGRASSYFSAGFLVGGLTGPLLGAALVGYGLRLPFVVYAIALVIATLVVAVLMPPVPPHPDDTPVEPGGAGGAVATLTFRTALTDSAYRAILAANFAQGWASMGVRIALVPLFITQGLGQSDAWAGIILACYAAGNVVAILFSGRLTDRYGRRPVLLPGLAIAAGGTLFLGFTDDLTLALVLTAVAGIGSGLFAPADQAALGDVLGNRQRGGSALAAYGMSSDLGAVLGPIAAGAVATAFGFGPAFLLTGVVLSIALVMWIGARETLTRSD